MKTNKVKLVWVGMQMGVDGNRYSMWDVVRPILPGYDYSVGYPTMSREALEDNGILKGAI